MMNDGGRATGKLRKEDEEADVSRGAGAEIGRALGVAGKPIQSEMGALRDGAGRHRGKANGFRVNLDWFCHGEGKGQ